MSRSSNNSLLIALAVIAGFAIGAVFALLPSPAHAAKNTPYYYNGKTIERKPKVYLVAGYSTQRVVFSEWKRWGPNKAVGVGKAEGYPVTVTFSKPCRAVSLRFWGRAKLDFPEGYPSGWYAAGQDFNPNRPVPVTQNCANMLAVKYDKCKRTCHQTRPRAIMQGGWIVDRIQWKRWGSKRAVGIGTKMKRGSYATYGKTRVVATSWRWCPAAYAVVALRVKGAGTTVRWNWRKYCKR